MNRLVMWLCCLGLVIAAQAQPGTPVVSMTVSEKRVVPGKPATLRDMTALGKNGAPFLHIHPLESHGSHHHPTAAKAYSCPMHPEVTSDQPGVCPKCNMKLTRTDAPAPVAKPGEVSFHAEFPAPGLYKVWGQFQVGPKMVIAPFTVKVD